MTILYCRRCCGEVTRNDEVCPHCSEVLGEVPAPVVRDERQLTLLDDDSRTTRYGEAA